MTDLESLINIGPTLARDLHAAGIHTAEDLRRIGARESWLRVRKVNPDRDCESSRLAIEGAVRGVRWWSLKA
jgi:DNA transformation protein